MSGVITNPQRTTWLEERGLDSEKFRGVLQEIGLEKELLPVYTQTYAEIVAYVNERIEYEIENSNDPIFKRHREFLKHSHPGQAAWSGGAVAQNWAWRIKDALRSWFGKLEKRTIASNLIVEKVPLFKLHSPEAAKSEVTFKETRETGMQNAWDVTLFGTGLGASTKFSVRYTDTFVSSNGDYKLIYLPVPIRVSLVETYDGGKLIASGLRAEADEISEGMQVQKGLESLSRESLLADLEKISKNTELFPRKGDLSKTISTHEREWEFEGKYETKLGIEALNAKTSMEVWVRRAGKVALTFKLPAGHDYVLGRINKAYGIVWQVL